MTIRKGIVKYWSVYNQVWETAPAHSVPDRELAAMPDRDRSRVLRASLKYGCEDPAA